mmetsp:Transcript_16036/g.16024  ORF Transcript_16036/g.16024 Transcript_16036/m.16024 type:complete len:171 (-) Transcript_16036:550-1062(-)
MENEKKSMSEDDNDNDNNVIDNEKETSEGDNNNIMENEKESMSKNNDDDNCYCTENDYYYTHEYQPGPYKYKENNWLLKIDYQREKEKKKTAKSIGPKFSKSDIPNVFETFEDATEYQEQFRDHVERVYQGTKKKETKQYIYATKFVRISTTKDKEDTIKHVNEKEKRRG